MFKLTSQADRVAAILEIINLVESKKPASAISYAQGILTVEVETRPRFKPCFVEGKWFPSTIDGARYLAWVRQDLWVNSKAAARMDAHGVMENLRNRIKNWCNDDYRGNGRVGYYWADPADGPQ